MIAYIQSGIPAQRHFFTAYDVPDGAWGFTIEDNMDLLLDESSNQQPARCHPVIRNGSTYYIQHMDMVPLHIQDDIPEDAMCLTYIPWERLHCNP